MAAADGVTQLQLLVLAHNYSYWPGSSYGYYPYSYDQGYPYTYSYYDSGYGYDAAMVAQVPASLGCAWPHGELTASWGNRHGPRSSFSEGTSYAEGRFMHFTKKKRDFKQCAVSN